MKLTKPIILVTVLALVLTIPGGVVQSKEGVIQCGNLIYARDKTSECFSDEFLRTIERKTSIRTERTFKAVKLAGEELYDFPFTLMTGQDSFMLTETERKNLKDYLTRGGFLLASAGCSSEEWNQSFRREIKQVFPDNKLTAIPMDHPIYHTVFEIKSVEVGKSGSGPSFLEGLEIDGKIVMIYSPQGLNDTAHTSGCCCCGGSEVKNSLQINVNIVAYALLH